MMSSYFYSSLAKKLTLKRAIEIDLPKGINAQVRMDEKNEFVFFMNFSSEEKTIDIKDLDLTDMVTGEKVTKEMELE